MEWLRLARNWHWSNWCVCWAADRTALCAPSTSALRSHAHNGRVIGRYVCEPGKTRRGSSRIHIHTKDESERWFVAISAASERVSSARIRHTALQPQIQLDAMSECTSKKRRGHCMQSAFHRRDGLQNCCRDGADNGEMHISANPPCWNVVQRFMQIGNEFSLQGLKVNKMGRVSS